MNLVSIFRMPDKQNKAGPSFLQKINSIFKDKIGPGVGFIITIVIVYVVITLFTIYNLLVSL